MVLMEGKVQIAHIGNFRRIFKGLLQSREQLPQFFFTLEVEFLCFEFHAIFVVHGLAGLNAQQHILHLGVLFAQIVGIVGNNQGQAGLTGQSLNSLIHGNLLGNAVILQFQIEIAFSKDLRQLQGVFFGAVKILPHQILGDGTG